MLYPIGIQSFESLRRDGYVYVDKTEHLYRLVTTGKYYFLSRPRRFGKSLLVSTLAAYLSGKKDLFSGLKLEGLEKEWVAYPVLRLDLGGENYTSLESVEMVLDRQLRIWESECRIVNPASSVSLRFKDVIDAYYRNTGRQVAILVDEYDKPIVDNFTDDALRESIRRQLQGFYSVLKTEDGAVRFGFFTGVTKIGKMSVFSGLNNLEDISLNPQYSDICGITESDLRTCFQDGIRDLASAAGIDEDACYSRLAKMYDGYHFCENTPGVYNPFSLFCALKGRKFGEYWFETGTPSFLAEVMRETEYDVTCLGREQADSTLLSDLDTAFRNPIPLLYQSGYLTIKDYDSRNGIYTLGFPNLEVKRGFLSYLLNYYTSARGNGNLLVRQMTVDLNNGNPRGFMTRLEAFFARQNYQIQADAEKDFQYAMNIILQLLGENVSVQTEKPTSDGRIDIVAETPDYVYLIEIKRDGSASDAISQIASNGYSRQYVSGNKKVFSIGVNFSTSKRCIDGWLVA